MWNKKQWTSVTHCFICRWILSVQEILSGQNLYSFYQEDCQQVVLFNQFQYSRMFTAKNIILPSFLNAFLILGWMLSVQKIFQAIKTHSVIKVNAIYLFFKICCTLNIISGWLSVQLPSHFEWGCAIHHFCWHAYMQCPN